MARLDKDVNRTFYDTQWEEDRQRFDEEPSKVHLRETLIPWLARNLRPGARILDLGGGSGVYASELVRAAPVNVVGLDLQAHGGTHVRSTGELGRISRDEDREQGQGRPAHPP